MKSSFILSGISIKTVHVSDKQIALLEPDDIKTDSTDQQSTDSKSENRKDNIKVASANSNEEKMKENNLQATRNSTRTKNSQKIWEEESIPTNLLEKGGMMGYIVKIRT